MFSALAEAPKLRVGPLRVRYLPGSELRVAFALPRRVGSAVVRNRIRRRLRAVLGAAAERLPTGAYLVGADREVLRMDHAALCAAAARLAEQVRR